MFKVAIHRNIYILALMLIAVFMPFSILLTSMAQFLLLFNYLLELDFKNKWKRFVANPPAWALTGIFLIHLIALLYTSNFQYAFHDLQIKLPLLVLPFIIGSSRPLRKAELQMIVGSFVVSVVVSSCCIVYYYFAYRPFDNIREISVFISHIRLSLMVNLALFFVLIKAYRSRSKKIKLLLFLVAIYLGFFLYLLRSGTGLFLLFLISLIAYLFYLKHLKNKFLKTMYGLATVLLILGLTYQAYQFQQRHFVLDPPLQEQDLKKYSPKGTPYIHDINGVFIENGHYVYSNIATRECKEEWTKRSTMPFDAQVPNGTGVVYILYRYLTSLNLPKDAEGIAALTDDDIKRIESGEVNALLVGRSFIYKYLYELVNQLVVYYRTGDANNGTLTERLEYLRMGRFILKDHLWIGVGTGDIDDAYRMSYSEHHTSLKKEFQHRAHNQFFTFVLTFGLIGFLLIVILLAIPYFYVKIDTYAILVSIVLFVSMLNEDTLETATGVILFTFFYSLFLIHREKKKKIV